MNNWEEFERDVCALYIETGSIQFTADQAGISQKKCREILIKHEYWSGSTETQHRPETLERYQAIAADYKSGASPQEIADAYCLPGKYVCEVLREQGFSLRKDKIAQTAKRNREILAAWENGAQLKDLSEKYGLAISTIVNILSSQGLDWRVVLGLPIWERKKYIPTGNPRGVPEGERAKEIKQAILNAKEHCIALSEVAKAYAVSRQYINQLADKLDYHPGADPAPKEARAERDAAIVEDHKDGLSSKDIAQKYGLGVTRVNYIIKKALGDRRKRKSKGDTDV